MYTPSKAHKHVCDIQTHTHRNAHSWQVHSSVCPWKKKSRCKHTQCAGVTLPPRETHTHTHTHICTVNLLPHRTLETVSSWFPKVLCMAEGTNTPMKIWNEEYINRKIQIQSVCFWSRGHLFRREQVKQTLNATLLQFLFPPHQKQPSLRGAGRWTTPRQSAVNPFMTVHDCTLTETS